MTDCDAIRDRIDAILDESSDAILLADIQDHINGCADCALHLRRQRQLIKTLSSSSPSTNVTSSLEQCIIDRLPPANAKPKPAIVRRVWFRIATAAAIAVVALGLFRLFGMKLPTDRLSHQYTAEELRTVETLIADIFPPESLTNAKDALLTLKNPLEAEYATLISDAEPVTDWLDALFPEAVQAD